MSRATLAIFLATTPLMGFPWPEVRPTPQNAHAERNELLGAWVCVEAVEDGRAIPVEPLVNPLFVVIDDDRYVEIPPGHYHYFGPVLWAARVYGLAVDTRCAPKAFDITFRSIGDYAVKPPHNTTSKGIYRIDKDTLVTCTGPTRPAQFAAPAGSGRAYAVFRRVKPQGPAVHPVPQAAAELDRLAGTWVQIEKIDDGSVTPPENFESERMKIEGNKCFAGYIDKAGRALFHDDDGSELAVDPNQRPKAVDFVSRTTGISKGIISRWIDEAIYRLEGDTLSICTGSRERPTEFTAPEGSGRVLEVYRRVARPTVDQRGH
jgi:uncharacterized protein (TIGR03067 family)